MSSPVQDLRPMNPQQTSYWESGYMLGGLRSLLTVSFPNPGSTYLLWGWGKDNRWSWTVISPWLPQSFNTNYGKGYRTIQFGGKMPTCIMCHFLLPRRSLPKNCKAPFSHSTLLFSSSCSSWYQAATKGLKRCLAFYYERRWSQDVSSSKSKTKPTTAFWKSVLQTRISYSWSWRQFQKVKHLALKLP